ncbi:ATP-dependent RNA helicase [Venturia inaequalis]|uniref:Histidine kinase n=1 Tax=Venturia inaequalis TaxID=5025 RepID=A0A8H3UM75_VENIN|nr:hypothetical protein EG327_009248 [Venturia inaequalis]RDI85000.1 ATP-dependent RNA helicase [Venturia inaequalis]
MDYEIIDLSPVPTIVLDASQSIQRASRSFLNQVLIPAEECVGADFFDLFRDRGLLRDDCAGRLRWALDTARATKTMQRVHHMSIGSNHGRLRCVPILRADTLVCYVLEWHRVTTPVREDHLEMEGLGDGLSTNDAFRILIEAVKDYAIFLLDSNGYVVTWNVGAELNKRYKREEIIGKHVSVFYSDEDLRENKPQLELDACLREGRIENEGWRFRKDGTRFWANVTMNAVYSNGVHVGFGKVTRDLTERKAAETRIIAAYDESAKLKSEFLANMSHEIRTPMFGMLSANALLLDTNLTGEQRDLANIIEESGQVLVQIINDILDYSKLAAGAFSIVVDNVDIAHINQSIVRGSQPILKPNVNFQLDLSPDLPKIVKGDPLRYRQVVQNLINNAGKFTDEGSVRLQSSVIEETDDQYTIKTDVIDTGIGIDASAREHLFTPFTQFDNTTTKRYKGTGLGLSISKSLTELMGGVIEFQPNESGKGSHFWFTVKMQKVSSSVPTSGSQIVDLEVQMAANQITTSPPTLAVLNPLDALREVAKTKRLLLAEDNMINQRVMIKVLRAFGFTNIDTAGDGVEAVRLVTASIPSTDSNAVSPIPDIPNLSINPHHPTSDRDPDPQTDAPSTTTYSTTSPLTPTSSATSDDDSDPQTEAPSTTTSPLTPTSSATDVPIQPYDLILMDINMPRLDGFGATSAIRSKNIHIPILAMTANALRGDREECIAKGMSDYVSKPMERGELVRVLSRWLVPGCGDVGAGLKGGCSAKRSVGGSVDGGSEYESESLADRIEE